MRPDPLSGSKDEEGRRLVRLNADQPDRGWRVVNADKYRRAVHDANAAARMRRLREERAGDVPDVPNVPKRSHDTKRDDTKRDEKKRKEKRGGNGAARPSLEVLYSFAKEQEIPAESARKFFMHFEARGWPGIKDFRPALVKWACEDREKRGGSR
jgi:hypothetical protein